MKTFSTPSGTCTRKVECWGLTSATLSTLLFNRKVVTNPDDEKEEALLDIHINWDHNPLHVSELEGTETRYRTDEDHRDNEPYASAWIQISEPPTFYRADKKLQGEDDENEYALVFIRV